jgi:predicted GNAT superfamily acetyltransferase
MAASEIAVESIEIRGLTELDEFRQTLEIQRQVWAFAEYELFPVRLFIVTLHVGGLAHGAFLGERMVGFSVAIPGCKPGGKSFLHSNMTGVIDEFQNQGLGRGLKLKQREDALAAGYDLIEWTFDPLEIRNAHFNIERLGAVMRRYEPNCYGVTRSPLHGGLPTDRLVAEWHLADGRVEAILGGADRPRDAVDAEIEIPADVRSRGPDHALEVQSGVRRSFLELFEGGYVVRGYRRSERGGVFELTGPESKT